MNSRNTHSVALTAADWRLYTHANGVDRVAERLNVAVSRALAIAEDRIEATEQVLEVMEEHAEWGAAEEGPACVLGDLLDVKFNPERSKP